MTSKLLYRWLLLQYKLGLSNYQMSMIILLNFKQMSITILLNFEPTFYSNWQYNKGILFSCSCKQSGNITNSGDLWPPFRLPSHVSSPYTDPQRIIACRSFHAVIFMLLYKALNETSTTDHLLALTVYLLELTTEYQAQHRSQGFWWCSPCVTSTSYSVSLFFLPLHCSCKLHCGAASLGCNLITSPETQGVEYVSLLFPCIIGGDIRGWNEGFRDSLLCIFPLQIDKAYKGGKGSFNPSQTLMIGSLTARRCTTNQTKREVMGWMFIRRKVNVFALSETNIKVWSEIDLGSMSGRRSEVLLEAEQEEWPSWWTQKFSKVCLNGRCPQD